MKLFSSAKFSLHLIFVFTLLACGGGGGSTGGSTTANLGGVTSTVTVTSNGTALPGSGTLLDTTATGLTNEQAKAMALTLWRNDDLSFHPKGSCAGCHGADIFDLARIG